MTAVINFSQWLISRNYRPAKVGVPHSNQLNFLEHSEEPYNKYRYLRLIPNLQLTSARRTGTAIGPQSAVGPQFAQVCCSRTSGSEQALAEPVAVSKLTVP